jgi:hypothetical protein
MLLCDSSANALMRGRPRGKWNRVSSVTLWSALLMVAVPAAAGSAQERSSRAWVVVASPNVGSSLNALSADSASPDGDLWAIGFRFPTNLDVARTLAERWDGLAWRVVKSPNVGQAWNQLNDVVALSRHKAWAVGTYTDTQSHAGRTLIERWNGTSWRVVPSPNAGTGNNELLGVAAVSGTNVWAVGDQSTKTLVEHWDGSTWTRVPSPYVGGLIDVAAISSTDVWAVGGPLVEHWDGSTWTRTPSPDVGAALFSVSGRSTDDVWAVGVHSAGGRVRTLIEHWDGLAWSVVPSKDPGAGDDYLTDVVAVSVNAAWAVGYFGSGTPTDPYKTLVERWDGTAWRHVVSPNPSTYGNYLGGVSLASNGDVWAVGSRFSASANRTLIELYASPTSADIP